MNEKQIEKNAQREADRLDQFQQRKWAEELTDGMALRIVRNAALEQLGQNQRRRDHYCLCTSCRRRSCVLGCKKHQYTSRTLCYSVSLALQAPQVVKKEKPDNREIRVCDAKYTALRRDQKGENELAGIGMANKAARKRRAMAVLKSTLAKQ